MGLLLCLCILSFPLPHAELTPSYTYELCFFGTATQKSNKDHSSNNLGHFVEWNPAAKAGEYEYYTKMAYRNG